MIFWFFLHFFFLSMCWLLTQVSVCIFSTFSGITFAADAIHCYCQCGVRFERNTSKTHCSSDKSLDNLRGWLHLGNWDRCLWFVQLQLSAQRAIPDRLHGEVSIIVISICVPRFNRFLLTHKIMLNSTKNQCQIGQFDTLTCKLAMLAGSFMCFSPPALQW